MGSSQVNIYLWRSLMKETSIRRNSVIELLRLIAMFAIVLHHYSIHGGMALAHGISCSTLTIAAGQSLGEWGVDVFVLITGYYLSNNLSVSKLIKRTVKFYVQVWTTSILCLLAVVVLFRSAVGIKDVITGCLPIGYHIWWFASTYFVLLLMSPFINVLVWNISKKRHAEMIVLMVIFWSILCTIFPKIRYEHSDLLDLVMLYVIASYIRRYMAVGCTVKWIRAACVCLLFIMMGCSMLTQMLSSKFPLFLGRQMYFVDKNSPLTIAAAIATLLVALSMSPRHSAVINRISSASFGIYLFTDHPLISPILWINIVHTQIQFYSKALPALMIGSVLSVFFAALAVEMLRQVVIQKPVMLLIESTIYKAQFINCIRLSLDRYLTD
jgi:surface polysaccharide O-acyltransferase-like enzyme